MRIRIALVMGAALALMGTLAAAQEYPRFEVPLDYSYFRFNPQNNNIISPFSLNGGGGAGIFYVSKLLGLQADFQGYASTTRTAILPLGSVGCPASLTNLAPCAVSAQANLFTYNFGPIIKLRFRHFEPFVEALGGGAHSNFYGNLAKNCSVFGCVTTGRSPSNNAAVFIIGGGVDIPVSAHFGIRLAQVDYVLTRFGNDFTFGNNNQSSFRVQGGLLFRFGGGRAAPPPPSAPPTASCTASPSTVYAGSGDSVSVAANASSAGNQPLNYAWTATGGTVDGSGPQVRWSSAGLATGTYSITARVDDGRGGTTTCDAEVRVAARPNRPPTMSCSVSPSSVRAGQPVRIIATANDPDNDPLTFTWLTSGGLVVGSGAEVRLDTTGLAASRYTVTGRVDDEHGGAAACQADVTVEAPPPPPAVETRLALHSVYFPTALPEVASPDTGLVESQQQTLTSLASDFKQYLSAKPDARLLLQGHADRRGSEEYNRGLSERRVELVRHFLVTHGVPEANIETKAFGEEENLTPEQVKQLVEQHPDLSEDQRQKILDNLAIVTMAQNRRVDIVLGNTGQQSIRRFPFNAVDSLTLISPKVGGAKPRQ